MDLQRCYTSLPEEEPKFEMLRKSCSPEERQQDKIKAGGQASRPLGTL